MVAIVPDANGTPTRSARKPKRRFPVLIDMDNGYAMSLNLVFWVGDEMRRFMSKPVSTSPNIRETNSWMVPVPATFVVGNDGVIRARFVDPDYRKRMTVETMLAALRA